MKKRFFFYSLASVGICGVILAIGYFAFLDRTHNPTSHVNSDKVLRDVGRLIVLPQGERPTVAVVTNSDQLKNDSFFSVAKEGDQVLIYSKARKAYIYDPIARKIVDVGNVNSK
ncbi:hypothetical protein KW783_00350 [Candidatus Parcubacteria bacterium]|nr:hypothetical protein [Candidatus Parcubacteria bacterium]